MDADIKECTYQKHEATTPHHHTIQGRSRPHDEEFRACEGCQYAAPLYRRTPPMPDVTEQVRKVVEAAKAWERSIRDGDVDAALLALRDIAKGLPDDWVDRVAIVRKLTRDELMAIDKAPKGHALGWVDGEGAIWWRDEGESVPEKLPFEFRVAYLLPTGVQA